MVIMISRRFIIYQKNVPKPIVISDDSEMSDIDVKKQIQNCFIQKDITQLETEDDILFLRPSEISAIMIHKVNDKDNGNGEKVVEETELKITDKHVEKKT
jgi:hypothetical protein